MKRYRVHVDDGTLDVMARSDREALGLAWLCGYRPVGAVPVSDPGWCAR